MITLDVSKYNAENVYFFAPVANNIIANSIFTKMIYSTDSFIMNGIYILLPITDYNIEKRYNKNVYSFQFDDAVKNRLVSIEGEMLANYKCSNKTADIKLREHIQDNKVKISIPMGESSAYYKKTLIIKISGIWENAESYGITYKFIMTNNMYHFPE